MIILKDVSILKKNKLVLNNLNVSLNGKIALIGSNNSGKTKLLEAICGKGKIVSGTIELSEEFVNKNALDNKNNGFMFIPKNFFNFFEDLRVKHIYSYFVRNQNMNIKLFEDVNIYPKLKFRELSHIQKLALFISIGLKTNKKIFAFDEPLIELDVYEKLLFKKIIDTYLKEYIVIITSNNPLENIVEFDLKFFIHEMKLLTKNPFPVI